MRQFHNGENNSGHYNFVLVDREIIFVTDKKGHNIKSALNLSLEALGLYVILKAHAIDKNFVWPSITTLEELTGKSDKTILLYIKELIDKGLIVKEKMKNPKGGRDCNVYIIPSVNKEEIKNQSGKFPYCPDQSGEIPPCKAENLPVTKAENFRTKETNINILSQLRLRAQMDILPDYAEETASVILENINLEQSAYIVLSGSTLRIRYSMPDIIRRHVVRLLDLFGLYDTITVIYE